MALIAFSAGMEMDLPALGRSWKSLFRHGGILIAVVFLGLFLATLAASRWLPFTAGEPWSRRVAVALVLAAVMATFSPTVTMAVLAETRARGLLAERVLALVVMGDLGLVLVFTPSTTLAKLLDHPGPEALPVATLLEHAAGHVIWEVLGSLAAGLLVGAGLALYRRLVNRRSGLVVAAAGLVLAEVGSRVGLSSLRTCLMAGFVVRNAAAAAAHELEELLGHVRLPRRVTRPPATARAPRPSRGRGLRRRAAGTRRRRASRQTPSTPLRAPHTGRRRPTAWPR